MMIIDRYRFRLCEAGPVEARVGSVMGCGLDVEGERRRLGSDRQW
jgi:hypothetical protein